MYILLENKIFRYKPLLNAWVISLVLVFYFNPAFAFNEFQKFIEEKSKKQLNCAYCHSHTNGPEGNEEGQLSSLSEEEKQLTVYNQYLQANKEFLKSPILNDFGNYLVKKLGYETIVKAQDQPEIIAKKLKKSDFDKDGISDSEEIQEGTLSHDQFDGNPLRLFLNNLKKSCIDICFQAIAILLLIFSLLKLKTKS